MVQEPICNISGEILATLRKWQTVVYLWICWGMSFTGNCRKNHQIEDRIVSIDQPHIRPIVRGKAGCPVEFGAMVTIGLVGGCICHESGLEQLCGEQKPETSSGGI